MKKGIASIIVGFTIIATAWGIEYLPSIETAYFQARHSIVKINSRRPTEKEWVQKLKDEWLDFVYAEYHSGKPHRHPENYNYGATWKTLDDGVKLELEDFFAKAWGRVLKAQGETQEGIPQ